MSPIDTARARGQAILREAAEIVEPLAMAPIDIEGPGRAIGDIIFELVRAGMAWAAGKPRVCQRRLTRAANALAILRVQIDQRAPHERLPRR